MSRVVKLTADRRDAGSRLDIFLTTAVEGLSRKRAKRLVDGRAVSIGGKIESMASRTLKGGEEVTVRFPPEREAAPTPKITVIVQDDHFVALDKPVGLPSGPTKDPKRPHAEMLAKKLLGEPLTLLHRIDRDTSGVLLLGSTEGFSKSLLDAFRRRKVEKSYLALVSGSPPAAFEDVCHLKEVEGARVAVVKSGGMRAETRFVTLAQSGGYALVRCHPKTGRMHQLRAQLARRGFPILGDSLYGGAPSVRTSGRGGKGLKELAVARQMLHAHRLGFDHPVLDRRVEIEAKLPEDFETLAKAIFGKKLPGV